MVAETRHTIDGQVITCGYCPCKVVFHPTALAGHALCFDAGAIPAREDRMRTGWMPGMFLVDGELRYVYAPWMKHGGLARRQSRMVLQLHVCPGQTRAVSA